MKKINNFKILFLLLFLIAGLQNGISIFKGIADLANKESSRAHEMKKILNQVGIKCKLKKDEIKIYGKGMINASNKKINGIPMIEHVYRRVSMSKTLFTTYVATCDKEIFDIEKGLYFGRKNSFSENLNIFINGFISNEEEEINWSIEKI